MRCRRLLVALAAALLLAGPQPLFAHAQPNYVFSYRGPTKVVPGQSYTAPLEFRNSANASRYVKTASISRATVGGLLRARLFSPLGLGVTAAITAAGWAIDELQQQVLMPAPDTTNPVQSTVYRVYTPIGEIDFNSCDAMATSADICRGSDLTFSGCNQTTASGGVVMCYSAYYNADVGTDNYSIISTGQACPAGYQYDANTSICILTDPATAEPVPATDDDLSIIVDSFTPSQRLDLFYDSATGQPMPIPEEQAIHDQLEQDWIAQNDTDPNTVPTEQIETIEAQDWEEAQQREEDIFNPPSQPQFDTDLTTPDKRDLVGVLDNAKSALDGFASQVALNATAGACSITVPVNLAGASSTGTIDFCAWDSALIQIGQILLMLSYLAAGIIVLRA